MGHAEDHAWEEEKLLVRRVLHTLRDIDVIFHAAIYEESFQEEIFFTEKDKMTFFFEIL